MLGVPTVLKRDTVSDLVRQGESAKLAALITRSRGGAIR